MSLIQTGAAKQLEEFLKGEFNRITNYELYRERFTADLAETLQDNLPEDYPEDRLQRLARDCALNEAEAVDEVNQLLTGINLHMDDVHRAARVNRAKELVKQYVRCEPRSISLIHNLLAKAGTTIDALIIG